jgi:Na+/H+ antiporter NhaD/arsenite permease-like protein
VLWVLIFGLLVLTAIAPGKLPTYLQLVDWPTIQTLLGLFILTKGIEASGWLSRLAVRIEQSLHTERALAQFLMALSVLLAMFLTNDVALFVVVPLTLSLGAIVTLPLRRLVIFEAIAVNCGSLLTPIGNPQNIFLWQHSGVTFLVFTWKMLPLFLFCLMILAGLIQLAFKAKPIHAATAQTQPALDRRLLLVSAMLYLPFLVMADLHRNAFALGLVAFVMLIAAPRILRQIDWPLMLVFVLMFIDLRLLTEQAWLTHVVATLDLQQPLRLFAAAALLSQGLSNVPASILLSGYSTDWLTIAWGVNVGGFGLLIGSLANLIALRIGRQQDSLLAFHAWSIPFFLAAGGVAWLWLWLG